MTQEAGVIMPILQTRSLRGTRLTGERDVGGRRPWTWWLMACGEQHLGLDFGGRYWGMAVTKTGSLGGGACLQIFCLELWERVKSLLLTGTCPLPLHYLLPC